jgi:hypothetical protein
MAPTLPPAASPRRQCEIAVYLSRKFLSAKVRVFVEYLSALEGHRVGATILAGE